VGSTRPSAREHRVPGGPPGGPLETRRHDRHDTIGSLPPVLHGRELELERLGELLGLAVREGRGAALTVLGDPGTGKTALLEAPVLHHKELRVLHGCGVRQEWTVPYAGLHRVLRPVAGLIGRLPAGQADALAPLASGGGFPPVPSAALPLFSAVCALLAEAAADGPVLVRIDDAHRLDRVSLEALAFAARRLPDVPVAFLFAARPGLPGSAVDECLADLPRLDLQPLDETASIRVLRDLTCGALNEEAAAEVAGPSGGNPLALVELAGALTQEQMSGTAPLPRALPPGSVLRSHYRRRYLRLTTGARRLALMAAADDQLEPATLARAAELDGIEPRELEWARASGLIQIDGGRVRMPGALVRSCLYAEASPSERRAVHDLLARALDGEWPAPRRAWHRAAPAEHPDDELADELARAAESLRGAGRYEDASRYWERSAALSTTLDAQAERYLTAAREAWTAGRARRARVLLGRVRPMATDPGIAGRADLLLGDIEFCDGLPVMAQWILREAAERLAEARPTAPGPALDALLRASAAADATGDHHYYRAIVRRALELAAARPEFTSPPSGSSATTSPGWRWRR
jgi:hypothetical protein